MPNLELDKTRLKRVAKRQRQLLVCIALLILFAIMGAYDRIADEGSIFNHELYDIPAIGYGVINLAAFIFVILLAVNVYNSTDAIILSLLCLIPGGGIIVMIMINLRATRLLRANGIKVGFMGADASQFK